MPRRPAPLSAVRCIGFVIAIASATACGGKAEQEQAQGPTGPALGVLELPVSLRSGDAAPGDARKVEINLSEVRVDDQVVLALANGSVAAAERQDGVLPKLKAALQSPARPKLALHTHASLPYETAALVLNTAAAAGMHQVAIQVRKPGASTTTGWLAVSAFQTTPRTDDEVVLSAVDPRKWDEFGTAWQAVYDACRAAKSGSCAYVQNNVAKGGNLKIVLHASGQGVNINFFRAGLSPEELAAEEKQREAELATKKEDFIQGRMKKVDLEQDLLEGPPATEALFQFRAQEAVDPPSALTEVMRPLCGARACGAVVSADSNTLMVRVVSLIGAAFADGSVAPTLAFEQPWTEKPKPPAAAVPAAPVK